MVEKPVARTYSASMTPETAVNPAAMGDKCFLCGQGIAEDAPRGFYTGKKGNALMLAHRGCLNKFEAEGHVWPGTEPKAVIDDAVIGPKNIAFESLAHMTEFLSKRGPIPSSVRVTIAGQVVQEGE